MYRYINILTIKDDVTLLIEQQIKQYSALNEWFSSPLGMYVAKEFTHEIDAVSHLLKGNTLLQLGTCGDNLWLNSLSFKSKWLSFPKATSQVNLACSFNQIPISRDSVDCIVVPLGLEPYNNSLSLIDELDRILKPMGCVIFLSLNPWSLWGAALKSRLFNCFADTTIKMRSPYDLNRVLLQRGYRQCSLTYFGYLPPINNQKAIKKLAVLNEIGKMIWPFPAGFYCYIAQKYEEINPALIHETLELSPIKDYNASLQPVINQLFV